MQLPLSISDTTVPTANITAIAAVYTVATVWNSPQAVVPLLLSKNLGL